MPKDEAPRIGFICIDGGTCHHSCTANEGCFRRDGCVPLSCSGLDDQWRTPEEAAQAEALEISGLTAAAKPANRPPRI